jgi:predicted ATPase
MALERLASFATTHYRNLSLENHLDLFRHLNVFIGPNGSGKSNLIAALAFLKDCIAGGSEIIQSQSLFQNAVAAMGGSGVLDRSLSYPADVNFEYVLVFSEAGTPISLLFELTLFVGKQNAPVTIKKESLSSLETERKDPFYYYKYHDVQIGEGVISVSDENGGSHFEKVVNVPVDSLGLVTLHALLETSKNPPESTPAFKMRRHLFDFIKGWHFYNANYMNLELIRNSEPKVGPTDIYLSKTGRNLALVIENLIQKDVDFEDDLNNAMRSILPGTRRIRPVRSGLMNMSLEWHIEGTKEPFYLNEMSDGTIRMLTWATILLSPDPPKLVVIDEPELGIHPSWMPVLAEWIKRASQQTQVIISTHSPDLLDCFTEFSENVTCFCLKRGSNFSPAPLTMGLIEPKLKEGWKLGDLYRVGDPSIGGWPW